MSLLICFQKNLLLKKGKKVMNQPTQSQIYPIYPVKLSDSGYFFQRHELDEPHYFRKGENFVFPDKKGYYTDSILMLGQDELYVLRWKNNNNMDVGLWFLDANLRFIANRNLLSNANFSNTNLAKLWRSYLEDVSWRIWYALITPGLLQSHPNFTPQETFISKSVLQDVKQIIESFIPPLQIVSINEINNSTTILNYYPPIQKNYLVNSLKSSDIDNWQDKAVLKGSVEIQCPFSGEVIQSNESIFCENKTVFYRFQSQGEIFFLICGTNIADKSGVYFPRINTFYVKQIKITEKIRINDNEFFLNFLQNWQLIKSYLLNGKTKNIVGVVLFNSYLGHNLWNDLSALERMNKNNILSKFSALYVFDANEIFAPIEKLFPTLQGKTRRISYEAIPANMYEGNNLFFLLGSQFIPRSITDKIISYSISSTLRETFSQNFQEFFKEKFYIVILFTLRFHNRSWLDQEQGISEIIVRLNQEFSGKIALIIDGHNTNLSGEQLKSFREDLIKKENGLDLFEMEYTTAESIKDKISSDRITVINTIGCSIAESINWCLLSDFFVAPWGAGLTKCKWITNRPGLVYSSRKVLTGKSDLHIYDDPQYREDTYPCEYVDIAMVFDVDDIHFGQEFRNNFSLSIDHLYEKISSMCKRFGRVR
jgi:hypothetical protein